jgi:dolichol kinase
VELVFNPLGPNLVVIWDIIAMVISFVAVLLVVVINGSIQKSGKLSTNVTRKIVHIFAAPVFLVTWLLYSGDFYSRFIAMIVPILFALLFIAIGTGKVKNESFVASMSRSGKPAELLKGTLYYAIWIILVTLIWFYVPTTGLSNANPTAMIIIGCLAGGDGFADVIGRKYGGKRKFGVGGAQKTPVGSLGMFIGSFLFSFVLIAIFSLEVHIFNLVTLIIPILIISIVAMIVEALTPKNLDNWTVPISVVIVIIVLLYIGLWTYPLWTLQL